MPDILCFNAPVKQRRNLFFQNIFLPFSKRTQTSTNALELSGIYVGDKPTAGAFNNSIRRQSKLLNSNLLFANKKTIINEATSVTLSIPPPKPPRTDLQVLKDLAKSKEQLMENNLNTSKQSVTSIVRSVSDYKTSELFNLTPDKKIIRKSRTDIFQNSPGIFKL